MRALVASFTISFLLVGVSLVYAGTSVQEYEVPDVRDAYCGVEIQFQYCKCAFHNDLCGNLGLEQSSASSYVLDSFREWNRERIQRMAERCLAEGGHWNKGEWSCTTCTNGDVLVGARCVAPQKAEEKDKKCELPQDFELGWEKYSDIDDAIAPGDASFEVGEYHRVLNEIVDMIARAQTLEYDMEIDREIRLELREYKAALVQNLRNNITKAIFRLAWVTYNTAQGAKGGIDSYKKLIDPESVVEGLGAGMKLIQSHIPAGEKDLQFDTKDTKGKVKSAAWNATLETLESVGDPQAVAVQVMKDVKGAMVGGPDLSPEEIEILRTQHLQNNEVDRALAESYAKNAERRKELLLLERQIATKYNELQEWKAKEYTRVKNALTHDCKE